ncbi:GNAT family N-acetyltransferase [Rhodanobacter sp. DHB23]|uniref:GNAT family N-acetyltransferase n=1 Tax=Rhodanobacter sp. DHB23 TaxID=2775923 RepID=UPI0017857273|nr:GNAT family N-acetyltransferase [Rhodanobacter sp. DHB23]MBD8873400.1 GNAT family N-acetyltransferase [Rhodanobacter sp. DHB23]
MPAIPANLDISPLRDAGEAGQAASWVYDEWAHAESAAVWAENRHDIAQSLQASVHVPKFFGARVDGALAGIASIVPHDLPTRPGLGPWLANVLVLPEWRRRGIGAALVQYAMDYAVALAPALYLYTFDQVELYRRLGWRTLETDSYVGRPITIMRYPAA